MQKIATRVFMIASVLFGVSGVTMILTLPPSGEPEDGVSIIFQKTLFICVFIILPSFALSVAAKYLSDKGRD